jgi:hypothetical protein
VIAESNLQIQHNSHENPYVIHRNRKISPKIHMETLKIAEAILSNKTNAGGIILLNFKL